jgi:flavodoxin/Pyruvate/2-oxoacid:ferredoxin oxidoreductase delta subunit
MSKALLVYFSQGGTTAQVAESIAAGLRAANYELNLHNLSDGPPPGPEDYDLLGIGSPAYYFRPPFNVTEYVAGLPDLGGLPFFVFVLHGTYPGDTGNVLRQALTRKSAQEVGYFHAYGADVFLGYLNEGYLFSADHPTEDELAQAEEFGSAVAARVAGEEYIKPEFDPSPAAIHRFERFSANRWLVEQVYSRLIRLNKTKCTACGLCVQECPTGNITADSEGYPAWGRECLACVFCEMNCPEGAVTSVLSWPLFRPFMQYNVRGAARDPSLDHVRVRFSKGKFERV